MYKNRELVLQILVQFTLIILTICQDWECKTKHANQHIDSVFAKLFTYGRSGRKFPVNQNEAHVYCNETIVLVKSAESYVNQCLKDFEKSLVNVLLRTIKAQANQLCGNKNTKRVAELYEAANCVNAAKYAHQKCINRTIDNMLGMQHADNKLKIPLLCCENEKIKECFHTGSKKYTQCSETSINVSLRFMDSITGNMMGFLCGDIDDQSDKCDHLVVPTKQKNQRRTLSFLPPLMKIMDSI